MEERISSLETENRDLLQNKYKSETAAQDSANKIKHFDLRDKQAILQKNHEQLSNLSETKSNLEDHATAMVKEVERVKNVNKMVSAELIKANEIIKKLQDDIRTLNSKTKLQV
jgi:spindle assembly abnormal protein 6